MLSFVGNCVLEFAPSGAYVEDWRQKSSRGPLLGLRLVSMIDERTGVEHAMDGGFLLAGEHAASARSRLPQVDEAIGRAASLEAALAANIATPEEVESYEVSVAISGPLITHSTQSHRVGEAIGSDNFSLRPDGKVAQEKLVAGHPCVLFYEIDVFEPDFSFDNQTPATPEAISWMELEKRHLARNAMLVS